jgi:hypothetical protein
MALGDVGMFLPTESQYKNPGSYDELLKAEAARNAAYLSSMDQFYAELNEKAKEFEEDLAFRKEDAAAKNALSEEKIVADKMYQQGMLQNAQNELNYKKQSASDTYDYFNSMDSGSSNNRGSSSGTSMNLSSNGYTEAPDYTMSEIDPLSDYDNLLNSLGI